MELGDVNFAEGFELLPEKYFSLEDLKNVVLPEGWSFIDVSVICKKLAS